jgi:hypothetical protein
MTGLPFFGLNWYQYPENQRIERCFMMQIIRIADAAPSSTAAGYDLQIKTGNIAVPRSSQLNLYLNISSNPL